MGLEHEMSEISFSLSIDKERAEWVTEELIAYNKKHTRAVPVDIDALPLAAPLEVYVLDGNEVVIGGLIGRTHSIRDWLEISILWVEEGWRGRNLGLQLMELAEQEAVHRGCRYARLATSDFQSPGFYEKLGYLLYGKLENCPPGVTCYYFSKELESGRRSFR